MVAADRPTPPRWRRAGGARRRSERGAGKRRGGAAPERVRSKSASDPSAGYGGHDPPQSAEGTRGLAACQRRGHRRAVRRMDRGHRHPAGARHQHGIGFTTELRAVKSMEALRKLGSPCVAHPSRRQACHPACREGGARRRCRLGKRRRGHRRYAPDRGERLACDELDAHRRVGAGRKDDGTGPGGRGRSRPRLDGAQRNRYHARQRTWRRCSHRHGHRAWPDHSARDRDEADVSPLERKLEQLTGQLVKATLLVTAASPVPAS